MTLQLREGGYYWNRLGNKIGPLSMIASSARSIYPFGYDGISFMANGIVNLGDICDDDLVEEWKDDENIAFAASPNETVTIKDAINPKHYTSHPSGIECIEITQHMSFTLGNALKYIWRADLKGGVEDLQKAVWYLEKEIDKRSGQK